MKDKLEVGHFIRTIKGIGRIEEITEDRTEIYFNCDTGLTISFIKKDFTQEEMAQYYKHSDNIIDLIEEKDFCEIEFYSERYKERVKRIFEVGYVARGKLSHINFENAHCQLDIINGEWSNHDKCLNPKIKSIVTKEQFESLSYKLGDDK